MYVHTSTFCGGSATFGRLACSFGLRVEFCVQHFIPFWPFSPTFTALAAVFLHHKCSFGLRVEFCAQHFIPSGPFGPYFSSPQHEFAPPVCDLHHMGALARGKLRPQCALGLQHGITRSHRCLELEIFDARRYYGHIYRSEWPRD